MAIPNETLRLFRMVAPAFHPNSVTIAAWKDIPIRSPTVLNGSVGYINLLDALNFWPVHELPGITSSDLSLKYPRLPKSRSGRCHPGVVRTIQNSNRNANCISRPSPALVIAPKFPALISFTGGLNGGVLV